MRIGIDLRALMDPKITGVQIYVINLLHALFKIDSQNKYILFANSFSQIESRIKIFHYPNVEYRIFHYPNKIFNTLQKFLALPKIDKIVGGVDLFFLPHWRTFASSAKVPLVLTFHDLSFEVNPDFFSWWRRMWHRFMNYAGAARRASAIIAVSESTKQDLIDIYGISPNKIYTIYSGVKKPSEGTLLKFPHLPARFFLSFGTFEPRKNQLAVLAAYAEYLQNSPSPLPLVVAGASGWKMKSIQLPDKMKDLVFILKDVSEEEKGYLYDHAFALLFASFYEGFGFPVLEAASSGVPVIASYATSLAEIAKGFAVFVNPLRSSQIAQAMLDLEAVPSYYEDLKKRGLEAVREFTWENTARETLKLFMEQVK